MKQTKLFLVDDEQIEGIIMNILCCIEISSYTNELLKIQFIVVASQENISFYLQQDICVSPHNCYVSAYTTSTTPLIRSINVLFLLSIPVQIKKSFLL